MRGEPIYAAPEPSGAAWPDWGLTFPRAGQEKRSCRDGSGAARWCGMTVHEPPVSATVEWYTPRSLFTALGVDFDLDPAAGPFPQSWVPARTLYRKADDGLAHDWHGHVWLNPPYGPAGVEFVDRMIEHGDGLLLLPSRTETAVYQRALAAADAVCFLRDRLWFVRDDGHTGRSSFGSTLFAFGDWAAAVLRAADLGWTTRARDRTRGKAGGPVPRKDGKVGGTG